MKKSQALTFCILAILVFSCIPAITADVDGVFEMWRNQEGKITLISLYNEDCTECRGPEYQQQICQLAEGGCTCCGICYTEYCGGIGSEPTAAIEEKYWQTHVYVVNSSPIDTDNHDVMWLLVDTGNGTLTQSSNPESFIVNGNYVPITDEYITDESLSNIQVGGTFNQRTLTDVGSFTGWCDNHGWRVWQYHFETVNYTLSIPISSTSERNEGTIYVDREDNYGGDPHTTRWWIGDHAEGTLVTQSFNQSGVHGENHNRWFISNIDGDWDDLVVEGQEREHTKTIQVTLPSGGGIPTLEPKNYGVPILGTKYGANSIDEIPPELLQYTKEINGELFTYSDSKLDQWIYENIYKPNHEKSFSD